MAKQLTPMRELIEFMRSSNIFNETTDGRKNEFKILKKAKELLKKEKQVIIDTYDNYGIANDKLCGSGKQYYKEMFKTK